MPDLSYDSQSVVAFEKQYISLDDLSEFQRLVGLPQQAPTIHGENDPSMPGNAYNICRTHVHSPLSVCLTLFKLLHSRRLDECVKVCCSVTEEHSLEMCGPLYNSIR